MYIRNYMNICHTHTLTRKYMYVCGVYDSSIFEFVQTTKIFCFDEGTTGKFLVSVIVGGSGRPAQEATDSDLIHMYWRRGIISKGKMEYLQRLA